MPSWQHRFICIPHLPRGGQKQFEVTLVPNILEMEYPSVYTAAENASLYENVTGTQD